MTEVFLCRTGQLAPRSRSELRRAGVIVVEVDDPNACQFVRSSEVISGDDMLWATLKALSYSPSYDTGKPQRERLAGILLEIVDARRPQPTREDVLP